VPGEKEWAIIFYKNTKFWGTPGKDYDGNDEALRIMVATTALPLFVETFTIGLDNLANAKYDINLDWERIRITIPVEMNTDEKVMADIKKTLDGPDGRAFYSAAQYYFQESKNLDDALAYCNTALEKSGEKFWMLRQKAQILAKMGKYKDAITVAERSSEVATKEGNADYPRMNAKSIEEWKKMK
jgi:tetratricopeptide (TPR) repeat protein